MSWIKARTILPKDPHVANISSRFGWARPDAAVGPLLTVWAWAGEFTTDGFVAGAGPANIDALVGQLGFADAMAAVGWLEVATDGLRFPGWELHNSGCAKTRARNAENQARRRAMSPPAGDAKSRGVTARVRRLVFERDGDACRYCGFARGARAAHGDYIGAKLTIDHVVPVSRGGDVSLDNLVTCCSVCNMKKGNRTPEECGMTLSPLDGDQRRGEEKREDIPPSLRSGGARQAELVTGTPSRKPDKPRKLAAGAHPEAIRAWEGLWLELRGEPYAWSPKEAAGIAAALKRAGGDLQAFGARARRLLEDPPDAWYAQNACPSLLADRWNQLAVRVVRRTPTLDERNANTLRATEEELLREA